ncbi:carboxylesterase family protein [Pseudonocardia sp. DSM 110487]|uniref:carboxylesterase/lipase family protein n=1 Tax=Pseudonocardia sp. DSM 110487 TaxID=2865833 RepID=UPI001C6A6BF0|nr:carboxylesterase family protein [Pseudonocardia sp. DSM 110487]QYN39686.1 carboxylesterase family protein [Pseudonocardia sp. DSM 110487]
MVRARTAAVVLCVCAALAACTSATAPEAPAIPLGELVSVEQGELLGATDGSVLRYRGIPYAAPPVGERRFTPPGRPQSWSGTRPATQPGTRCAQLPAAPGTPHATGGSDTEDCLTLDITVPAGTAADARLPVLVWIHGGGFTAGAGTDTDPRRLAEAGPLVVVTVNYRLGIFGFFGLPGLEGSGSFGLLDQRAALTWVRRNIAAFGGDPGRVTLAGQSAGADSVCGQLTSPLSAGLFHRVIMQSGECGTTNLVDVIHPGAGPAGDTWKPLPLLEAAGAAAAGTLGCPAPAGSTDPTAVLTCLRALPTAQLVGGAGYYWSPATGTPMLPRRPSDIVLNRAARPGVPILAGTTRDEGTLFTVAFFDRAGTPLTDPGFRALLSAAAGTRAGEAGAVYRTVDRSPGRAWSDVITDRAYACPGLVNYRALADRGPLYAYELADPAAPSPYVALPADLAGGSAHGAEMPYLFDLVPGQPELTAAQEALAAELVDRWARFATTGEPNAGTSGFDTVTSWPPWTGDGRLLTISGPGAATTVTPGPAFAEGHRCALWDWR